MRLRDCVFGIMALAAVSSAGAAAARPADEAAVAGTFAAARTALEKRDGKAAVATLSKADRARVERIRAAAISGTQSALKGLGPAERFGALGLRHYMQPAEIRRRDAASLVEYALEEGWLGPRIVRQAALGKVRVDGDKAAGPLLVDGQPAIVPATFVREDGRWRIDLGRSLQLADSLIRTTAALSKRTEDQVVVEMLERVSGRPVTPPR